MRTLDYCLRENKDADRLCSNLTADQRLFLFAVSAAFVFATHIVQFLFFLNPQLQASMFFLTKSVQAGSCRTLSRVTAHCDISS